MLQDGQKHARKETVYAVVVKHHPCLSDRLIVTGGKRLGVAMVCSEDEDGDLINLDRTRERVVSTETTSEAQEIHTCRHVEQMHKQPRTQQFPPGDRTQRRPGSCS